MGMIKMVVYIDKDKKIQTINNYLNIFEKSDYFLNMIKYSDKVLSIINKITYILDYIDINKVDYTNIKNLIEYNSNISNIIFNIYSNYDLNFDKLLGYKELLYKCSTISTNISINIKYIVKLGFMFNIKYYKTSNVYLKNINTLVESINNTLYCFLKCLELMLKNSNIVSKISVNKDWCDILCNIFEYSSFSELINDINAIDDISNLNIIKLDIRYLLQSNIPDNIMKHRVNF